MTQVPVRSRVRQTTVLLRVDAFSAAIVGRLCAQRTGGADPSPQFGAALTISFPETAGGSTTVFAVMRAVERFVTRCAPDEPGTLAPKGTGRIAAVPPKAHEAT